MMPNDSNPDVGAVPDSHDVTTGFLPQPRPKKPAGGRSAWPRCGARTRGERAGRRCQAAGCGFGGRCWLHGGAISGPTPNRQLVLCNGSWDWLDGLTLTPREKRAWSTWALPLHLYERLGPGVPLCDFSFVQYQLERAGVRRDIVTAWPQRIGYRVALRLAERGRVAFALVSQERDVFRATRKKRGEFSEHVVRVEAPELLAALRAAGTHSPKTPGKVAVEVER